jgi:hypothetical protein
MQRIYEGWKWKRKPTNTGAPVGPWLKRKPPSRKIWQAICPLVIDPRLQRARHPALIMRGFLIGVDNYQR